MAPPDRRRSPAARYSFHLQWRYRITCTGNLNATMGTALATSLYTVPCQPSVGWSSIFETPLCDYSPRFPNEPPLSAVDDLIALRTYPRFKKHAEDIVRKAKTTIIHEINVGLRRCMLSRKDYFFTKRNKYLTQIRCVKERCRKSYFQKCRF